MMTDINRRKWKKIRKDVVAGGFQLIGSFINLFTFTYIALPLIIGDNTNQHTILLGVLITFINLFQIIFTFISANKKKLLLASFIILLIEVFIIGLASQFPFNETIIVSLSTIILAIQITINVWIKRANNGSFLIQSIKIIHIILIIFQSNLSHRCIVWFNYWHRIILLF